MKHRPIFYTWRGPSANLEYSFKNRLDDVLADMDN